MISIEAKKTVDSYTKVNFDEVPEGWMNLAVELFERIDRYCAEHEFDPDVIRDWYVSSIDLNKNGKLILTGKHIFRFTDIIKDIAHLAESVCCVCANPAEIITTGFGTKLPLCPVHKLLATPLN